MAMGPDDKFCNDEVGHGGQMPKLPMASVVMATPASPDPAGKTHTKSAEVEQKSAATTLRRCPVGPAGWLMCSLMAC